MVVAGLVLREGRAQEAIEATMDEQISSQELAKIGNLARLGKIRSEAGVTSDKQILQS